MAPDAASAKLPPAMATLDDLQRWMDNPLPAEAAEHTLLSGSMGESPSKYSRSPAMWNAAFRDVGLDAFHAPFDVRPEHLAGFVEAAREIPGFMGSNVTVPHKLAIMALLDEIDPVAREIGAVNTFLRAEDGRLVGFNTDADGLIASMLRPLPGKTEPFLPSLAGRSVLLLGAGGAGRAAAFGVAREVGGGSLLLTNRSPERAAELAAQAAASTGASVSAVGQEEALAAAARMDVVVNASTVGQSGVRRLGGGEATSLEAFSSLAPASPAIVRDDSGSPAFWREWFAQSAGAIAENNARSAEAVASCKADAAFVDAVYSPDETALLRQARLSGRKTLNGKGMLVMQAAFSFVHRMTRRHLQGAGLDPDALYDRVVAAMADAF